MSNFWDSSVWGPFNLMAVLLCALLAASLIKKNIKILEESLIPTSVLGGTILLLLSAVFKLCTGSHMFESNFYGGNGASVLEIITYHALALGFIASTFTDSKNTLGKERQVEIFNTGLTTVSSYMIQAIGGMGFTMLLAKFMKDVFPVSGVLLCFGFGQGTGQALNYGNIYETQYGFIGGKSFGLTIAALGFLCASFGGVFYLSYLRRSGKVDAVIKRNATIRTEKNDLGIQCQCTGNFHLTLNQEGYTIVVIEHDMKFVMNSCNRILVLNFGQKICEGTPEEVRSNKEVNEAYFGKGKMLKGGVDDAED